MNSSYSQRKSITELKKQLNAKNGRRGTAVAFGDGDYLSGRPRTAGANKQRRKTVARDHISMGNSLTILEETFKPDSKDSD